MKNQQKDYPAAGGTTIQDQFTNNTEFIPKKSLNHSSGLKNPLQVHFPPSQVSSKMTEFFILQILSHGLQKRNQTQ